MSAPSWLPWVLLNGHLLQSGDAKISPLGDGFMFGLGAFETLRVLQGRPVFLQDHAARLAHAADELGLPEATFPEPLSDRCGRVLAANQLEDGSLKIVWFHDRAGDAEATGELIAARLPSYSPEAYARGFSLRTVATGDRGGKYASLKTLNYLPHLAERRQAQAFGYDDALFVGPGEEVLEGSASTIFAVKRGTLLTPALDGRILPGIARARVLTLAAGTPIREGRLTLPSLLEADEVFVTNALLGVMPVARIDDHLYDLSRNPITRQLRDNFGRMQIHTQIQSPDRIEGPDAAD